MLHDLVMLIEDTFFVVLITGAVLWGILGALTASWGRLSAPLGALLGVLLGPLSLVVLLVWALANGRSRATRTIEVPSPRSPALDQPARTLVAPQPVPQPEDESWWGSTSTVSPVPGPGAGSAETTGGSFWTEEPAAASAWGSPSPSPWPSPSPSAGAPVVSTGRAGARSRRRLVGWLLAAPAVAAAVLLGIATQLVWLRVTPADVALGDLRGDSSAFVLIPVALAGLTVGIAGVLTALRPVRSWVALGALASAPWVVLGAALTMAASSFTVSTGRFVEDFDVEAKVSVHSGDGARLLLAGGVAGMLWALLGCVQVVRGMKGETGR